MRNGGAYHMQTRGITGARAGHITCSGGHIMRNRRGISGAGGGAYHVQEEFPKSSKLTEKKEYFLIPQNQLIFF